MHLSLQITLFCGLCLQAQFLFEDLFYPILNKTEHKIYVYERLRNKPQRSRKKHTHKKKQTKKQVEMLPTWLPKEGRIEEEIQFLLLSPSLRSWFSGFKNVLFKNILFFFPVCILPITILSHAPYLLCGINSGDPRKL